MEPADSFDRANTAILADERPAAFARLCKLLYPVLS